MRRALLALLLALALPQPAQAQAPPPLEIPNQRDDDTVFEPLGDDDRATPLVPAPEALPKTALPELRVNISGVSITGNTALADHTLADIARPYLGRALTTTDIEALRRELTERYVAQGYLTSGAVIPDQDLADGVLQVRIVEGRVGEVRIQGNDGFRSSFLRDQILPSEAGPLHVPALEERLQLLQANPQIESVHAELRPGLHLGESVLRLRVVESRRYALALETRSHRSPVIGEINYGGAFTFDNLAGRGDRLIVGGEVGESLRDVRVAYAFPITRWGTRLDARFRWSESEVVEAPFDVLDIESDYITGGIALVQPVWRTRQSELEFGLIGEWRRVRTSLLGTGFSFSNGAERGTSQVSVLRPFVQWVHRTEEQVFALRAQASFGLSALGATDRAGAFEDATFTSGLIQAQYARDIEALFGTRVLARADLQLAADPLLTLEQFSVGGYTSVRGYRENQLVSDNGFSASVEARVPLWRRPDGTSILQIAPFVDVGRSWANGVRVNAPSKTVGSAGVGLRVRPLTWLHGEIYWAQPFVGVGNPNSSLADAGLHFRLTARLF